MRACPYCYVEVDQYDTACPTCEAPLAEEQERERYEDDGRDYADPGDFLRGYED